MSRTKSWEESSGKYGDDNTRALSQIQENALNDTINALRSITRQQEMEPERDYSGNIDAARQETESAVLNLAVAASMFDPVKTRQILHEGGFSDIVELLDESESATF